MAKDMSVKVKEMENITSGSNLKILLVLTASVSGLCVCARRYIKLSTQIIESSQKPLGLVYVFGNGHSVI